jgi:broad specificity phosphatase PhoE
MTTTIYFVRHGNVHNPNNIVYARLPRYRLSELGCQQAAAAAQALKDSRPAAIYTSPMLRARQTAAFITAEHPELKLKINRLINENYTPYQGKTFAEIAGLDIFAGVQPPFDTPTGLLARSLGFIEFARRRHADQSVIAVTHGDVVRVIVRWAFGRPPQRDGEELPFPGTGSVTAFIFESPNQVLPRLEYLTQ